MGKADAALARQLIDWLKVLRAKVFSDRSTRSELWSTREDGVTRDILFNQFCLLPKEGNIDSVDNSNRVEKVILCCSEVLQRYREDGRMKAYTEDIKKFYRENREWKNTKELEKGIERIVETYCDKGGFHHVLTEVAFLEIRSIQEERDHGIIPIKLNGASIKYLPFFSSGNTHWLAPQKHSRSVFHECQVLHRLFFKLLRRLYEDHHAAIDELEDCYERCVKRLSPEVSLPSQKDLDDLLSKETLTAVNRINRNLAARTRTGQ